MSSLLSVNNTTVSLRITRVAAEILAWGEIFILNGHKKLKVHIFAKDGSSITYGVVYELSSRSHVAFAFF